MLDKILMKRCGECNTPLLVRALVKWRDNGTISMVFKKDMRIVFMHADLYANLLSSLEELFGISLRRIAFETERNMALFIFDDLGDLFPGIHLAGRSKTLSRLVLNFFHILAYMFGFGRSSTVEFITGRRCVGHEINPYNLDSFAAHILGALEFLYRKPFEHKWVDIGPDEYLFIATDTAEKPVVSERMGIEVPSLLVGDNRLERCSRCGAPKGLGGNLTWFEEDGLIVEVQTGTRMAAFPAYSLATLFHELMRELGDDVCRLIVDSQKNWVTDHAKELMVRAGGQTLSGAEFEDEMKIQLKNFPVYGMGIPADCVVEGSSLTVKIENPFDVYLIAGYISGLYEIISGIESEISWAEPQEQVVIYSVSGKTDK